MPRNIPEHLRQRRTYSEDLRKRVIYQKYTLQKPIQQISIDLNISRRVVERILKFWRDTGEVVPLETGRRNPRKKVMTDAEVEVRFLNLPTVLLIRYNLLVSPSVD
jgi:transposase